MNYNGRSLTDICSARQLAEIEKNHRSLEHAMQTENARRRKVGKVTIELNEQAKKQSEILKAQLAAAQKANELLLKQAADSAKTALISQWIATVSLVASVASIVIMLIG